MESTYQQQRPSSTAETNAETSGFFMELFRDNCNNGPRMAVFLIVFMWAIFIFALSLAESGTGFAGGDSEGLSIATFVFQIITAILFIIFSGALFWYYVNQLNSSPPIAFK